MYNDNQTPTLGAQFLQYKLNINNQPFELNIWDSAGQERFQSCSSLYYLYDVTSESSFQRAKFWVDEVKNKSMTDTVIAMAANKCDLPKSEWKVDSEEAKQWCQKNGINIFYETSAKANTNVKEVFESVVKEYIEKRDKQEKKEDEDAIPVPKGKSGNKQGCC